MTETEIVVRKMPCSCMTLKIFVLSNILPLFQISELTVDGVKKTEVKEKKKR